MEEIIFWKEVDVKDELPTDNASYFVGFENEWEGKKYFEIVSTAQFNPITKEFDFHEEEEGASKSAQPTHWLKRVVIPILSDQEIEDLKKNYVEKTFERGYDVSQKRLIGGEGL